MIKDLLEAIKTKDKEKFLHLIKNIEFSLDDKEKKIIFKNKKFIEKQYEFYDKQQYIKKILLNSLYGSLLNPGCRMYDERIGQSVTLSGRKIVYHMMSTINEILTGKYDYQGKTIIYGDTDSVTENTEIYIVINDNKQKIKIKDLKNIFHEKFEYNNKTYFMNNNENIKTLCFNTKSKTVEEKTIEYLYSHKTNKKIYKITLDNEKSVEVTEDHSIIVERNGEILTIKPNELSENDFFISLKS